jgi:hypothetical protein
MIQCLLFFMSPPDGIMDKKRIQEACQVDRPVVGAELLWNSVFLLAFLAAVVFLS